jgi:hypothetical protein
VSRQRTKKFAYAGHTGARHDFLKLCHDLSHGGGWSLRKVFDDFLELSFCALAKTTHRPGSERSDALEERYMRTVGQREKAYIRRMPELLALAAEGLSAGADFLGDVAGDVGTLNEHIGQFFTPFDVSRLLARMLLHDAEPLIAEKGYITVLEPASGAGGMLLAVAEVLAELRLDVGRCMHATAVDLSPMAYQMTYVQLSLRGVPAHVYHANSLTTEVWDSQMTPAFPGFFLRHGPSFVQRSQPLPTPAPGPLPEVVTSAVAMQVDKRGQGLLFL